MATLNPYLPPSKTQQILPGPGDWWQGLLSPFGQRVTQYELDHWFNVTGTKLPDIKPENCMAGGARDEATALSSPAILKQMNFKPAGADALQQGAAAAAAYLTVDFHTGFKNAQNCWAGTFTKFIRMHICFVFVLAVAPRHGFKDTIELESLFL